MLPRLEDLVALLLPPTCARCGREPKGGDVLCALCDAALPRWPAGRCRLCQQAPPGPDGRCRACAESGGPLAACVAAAPFAGEVAEWIRRFKYPRPGLAGLDSAAEGVATALCVEAAARLPGRPPDAVVPVPVHPARLRARGLHPAAALARGVARRHGLWLAPDALLRLRDTPSQTGLSREARRRNVAGAFAAAPGRRGRPGRRVWLVDDVVTTGATLAEAARAVRRAGAREVLALAAARTPGADEPR